MSIFSRRRVALVTLLVVAWFGTGLTGTAEAADHGKSGTRGKSSDAPGQIAKSNSNAPAATSSDPIVNNGNANSANAGQAVTPDGCPNTFHHVNTGNGANTSGAYDSTCDGSASQNGNGNGKATGKPCAGCVGNADFKNPKGQSPNGSDHNKGYECDSNKGVGKGNPAHSSCKVTPQETPTTTTPYEKPGTTTTTTAAPEVLKEEVKKSPAPVVNAPVSVAPAEVKAGNLASTGSETMRWILIGSVLLASGLASIAIVAVRKRGINGALGLLRRN